MKLKHFVILVGILVLLWIGYWLIAELALSGAPGRKNTVKNAVENYNQHEKEFAELIRYFNLKIPDNRSISFGLGDKKNRFDIGIALSDGRVDPSQPNTGGTNLKLNTRKADSLLALLGWRNETIDSLRLKLSRTGCVNIMSGDPIRIDYGYSGLGLTTYLIFKQPLADSMIKMYNEEFHDTVIGNNVVVIYTSSL